MNRTTPMAPAKGCLLVLDKVKRCVRTVIFMVAMVASLLVSSMPVLVAIGDVLVQCVLVSSFTCLSCYGVKEHLHRYAFKSSLTDIPLVSVVRSLIIICTFFFLKFILSFFIENTDSICCLVLNVFE